MDTIRFSVEPTIHWYGDDVAIEINGKDLIELIRAIELPFADAEGAPRIPSAYAGLPVAVVLPPSRHFWGESEVWRGAKIPIFACGSCGETGCWPLLVQVQIETDQIIWSDFEQPFRREGRGDLPWRYNGIGPFRFDREQYDAALRIASSRVPR